MRSDAFLPRLVGAPAVEHARAELAALSADRRSATQQAQIAYEAGKLALDPGNPVSSGSSAPIALNLFRQSIYWSLVSQRTDSRRPRPSEAWAEAAPDLLARASKSEKERARIAVLLAETFVELAEGAPANQRKDAEMLRRAAARLLRISARPLLRLEWSKLLRAARVIALGLALLAVCAGIWLVWLKPRNLAEGKSWRTSSIGIVCTPEKGDCGGTSTDILFHTKEEPNPWFEYDLGAPVAFSSLVVRNRSDFGPERAVPIVAEVSDDDKNFRQIARREDVFGTWRPHFPTQHARYVRLRVARVSILHLEGVEVYP